jgi:GST-like protein
LITLSGIGMNGRRDGLDVLSAATTSGSCRTMIDLYTAATMNGRRAALALAECGLAHHFHRLDLQKGDQRKPDFLKINAMGTIPVIIDATGPGDQPIIITQSAAIVLYCAEKSGKLIPHDPQRRIEAFAWFMQAITDVGPASSALFQLSLAPEQSTANATHFAQRFLKHCANVDRHLEGRAYLAGAFSIADVALYPVIAVRSALIDGVDLPNLKAWRGRIAAREQTISAMAANG